MSFLLVGVFFGITKVAMALSPAMPKYVLDMASKINVREEQTSDGTIYALVLPIESQYRVKPAVDDELATVETFTKNNPNAVFTINAGYFDPVNKETASYVTIDGKQVLDPTTNKRLTENTGLTPYLARIFNRSEFRAYDCASGVRYDIVPHNAKVPSGCQLTDALGAGPQLLPTLTAEEEAVIAYNEQKRLIRDPFGVNRPNARTAVGITKEGGVVFVLFSQNPLVTGANGFTFTQMTEALKRYGAVKALSLDGGSSSSMVVNGETVWAKYNKDNQPVKRPVKSVLMIVPN